MDPYLPMDYQLALLRSEYRNTTSLPMDLKARIILDVNRYPYSRYYPNFYYPNFYPPDFSYYPYRDRECCRRWF